VRIVLLSDWFLPRVGGLELHLKELSAELARRGHEVYVVTTTPADPAVQGRLQTRTMEVADGVEVVRLPLPVVPGVGLTLSPSVAVAVDAALEEIGPDVVHIHAGVVPPLALAGG
jgi:glycosyltransferase involved in cell wall biosynthesis